jgi:hypothetical protein
MPSEVKKDPLYHTLYCVTVRRWSDPPGSGVVTGEEIIELVKEYTGYTRKVSTVTKSMVRLMGLFDRGMREYAEMYYLNEEPVVLSGERYEREVGPLPRTDIKKG